MLCEGEYTLSCIHPLPCSIINTRQYWNKYHTLRRIFNKYTGARGKSGSNDANAEYVARLRNIMDTADVSFQTAELGKVDEGGGGTIAYILGNYDRNVIDSGVPVLNMHAPWEILSKVDLYEAFRGYIAFLKEA